MDGEEKVRRHLALGETLKIGDDEFTLKPISISELMDFVNLRVELTKSFKKLQKDGVKEEELDKMSLIELLDQNMLEKAKLLAVRTIEISYPEWSPELKNDFVTSNFLIIIDRILSINKLRTDIDSTLVEKAKMIGNV